LSLLTAVEALVDVAAVAGRVASFVDENAHLLSTADHGVVARQALTDERPPPPLTTQTPASAAAAVTGVDGVWQVVAAGIVTRRRRKGVVWTVKRGGGVSGGRLEVVVAVDRVAVVELVDDARWRHQLIRLGGRRRRRNHCRHAIRWRFSAVVASFVARTKLLNVEPG